MGMRKQSAEVRLSDQVACEVYAADSTEELNHSPTMGQGDVVYGVGLTVDDAGSSMPSALPEDCAHSGHGKDASTGCGKQQQAQSTVTCRRCQGKGNQN